MKWTGGNCIERGKVAYVEAMQKGATPLGAAFAAVVASFPNGCFLTYKQIATRIKRTNGKEPHIKSVGRSARRDRELSLFDSKRIWCGHKDGPMDLPSAHGTTLNRVNFKKHLGMIDPVPQSERRKMRRAMKGRRRPVVERDPQERARAVSQPDHPKLSHIQAVIAAAHPAPPPAKPKAPMPDWLARDSQIGRDALEAKDARWRAKKDAPTLAGIARRDRAPPDG